MSQHWLDNSLAQDRRQAITSTNDHQGHWRIYMSLSLSELTCSRHKWFYTMTLQQCVARVNLKNKNDIS